MNVSETTEKSSKTKRRVLTIVGALLLVVLGFLVGFSSRGLNINYLALPIASGGGEGPATSSDLSARVTEVQDILASEAFEPSDLDTATSAVANALLQANGDRYGRYFDSMQWDSYLEQNDGEFAGIGILISEYEGSAYVVRVFPDTPAAAAGLQEGDFITSIDGDVRTSWSMEEATGAISGTPGTLVELGWRRPAAIDDEGGEAMSAVIECATVEIPNVSHSLDGEIGYIAISQFTRKSTEDVQAALGDLEAMGARGYIVDLRGNPGGYLAQSVEISSLFIQSGTVVEIDSRNSGVSRKQVEGNLFVTDKPLVILVDANSASAAEIMAAACKDHGRAVIVGTTTFGKGTVQATKELSFGGGMKYTIAQYLSPNGDTIDGVGVTPDIVVEMEPSLQGSGETDTQYQAALLSLKQTLGIVDTPASDSAG